MSSPMPAFFEGFFSEQDDRCAALDFDAQVVRRIADCSLEVGALQHFEGERRILADRRKYQDPIVHAVLA